MGKIEIDFQKSMRQAEELERIAVRLQQLAENNMNGTLQNISEAWKGENSDKFRRKGRSVQEDIIKTAREIRIAAGSIRAAAKAAYDAEKRAAEIAGRRSYRDGH